MPIEATTVTPLVVTTTPVENSSAQVGVATPPVDANKEAPPAKTPEQLKAERSARMTATNLRLEREKKEQVRIAIAKAKQFDEMDNLRRSNPAEFLKRAELDEGKLALDYLERNGGTKEAPKPPTTDESVKELREKLEKYEQREKQKEQADRAAEQQARTQKAIQAERDRVKELLSDEKLTDKFPSVQAAEVWEDVYQVALALARQQGQRERTADEVDELIELAAEGVEKSLSELTEKVNGRKKSTVKDKELEAAKQVSNKEPPAKRITRVGGASGRPLTSLGGRSAPAATTNPTPKTRPKTTAEIAAEFSAKYPELFSARGFR